MDSHMDSHSESSESMELNNLVSMETKG